MASVIELGPNDACLVIREDGERMVLLPRDDDNSLIYGNSPTGLICKAAMALEDVECAQILQAKLEVKAAVQEKPGDDKQLGFDFNKKSN